MLTDLTFTGRVLCLFFLSISIMFVRTVYDLMYAWITIMNIQSNEYDRLYIPINRYCIMSYDILCFFTLRTTVDWLTPR